MLGLKDLPAALAIRVGKSLGADRPAAERGEAGNPGALAELRLPLVAGLQERAGQAGQAGLCHDGVVDGGSSTLPLRRTDAAP